MSELTAKQKAFIEQLPLNQWNGTQAAIAAGYSPKSAGVMACRLLKKPAIAKEVDKRTAEIVERTDVEVGEVIAELRKYAFDRGHKATNAERLKALELLGKYKAMFTDRRIEENPDKLTLAEAIKQWAKQKEKEQHNENRDVIDAESSDVLPSEKPNA